MINKKLMDELNKIPALEFKTVNLIEADQVKSLRMMIGVSQRAFARIMGISHKTVEKWESGKNPVTGTAAKLILILNAHPELLNIIYEFKPNNSFNPIQNSKEVGSETVQFIENAFETTFNFKLVKSNIENLSNQSYEKQYYLGFDERYLDFEEITPTSKSVNDSWNSGCLA